MDLPDGWHCGIGFTRSQDGRLVAGYCFRNGTESVNAPAHSARTFESVGKLADHYIDQIAKFFDLRDETRIALRENLVESIPECFFTPPPGATNPEAYDRLKNAPPSHRDGSTGGPGGGFASADKRIRNIEELLDELDKDECHEARWDTVELVLDYLNGNHTIATIRKHLLKDNKA